MRQILEKDSCVKDEIASRTKSKEGIEGGPCSVVRRCTCDYGEDRCQEEAQVESPFATKRVCGDAPEQGANQQSDVQGQLTSSFVRRVEF